MVKPRTNRRVRTLCKEPGDDFHHVEVASFAVMHKIGDRVRHRATGFLGVVGSTGGAPKIDSDIPTVTVHFDEVPNAPAMIVEDEAAFEQE